MPTILYVNPQLKNDCEETLVSLETWLSEKSYEITQKEKYGEDICDCCKNNMKLSIQYIVAMEMYNFSYTEDGDLINPYNYISEEELKTLIQKSKILTTQSC